MTASKRQQVLYVEDHPINALLMAAILERRPHLELLIAASGREALRMAEDLEPVLLLLDLGLPDCHGSQLLAWLRDLPGCHTPPAVAVTADATFEIANSGFCEVWTKPLCVENVLARLDALTAAAQPRTGGPPTTTSLTRPQLSLVPAARMTECTRYSLRTAGTDSTKG